MCLSAVLATGAPSFAQSVDIVPRGLYTERMRQDGNRISACVSPTSLMYQFEVSLAESIADVLLSDLRIFEVPAAYFMVQPPPLDYRMTLTEEQIYILFAEQCDLFMGFLLSSANPPWLTVTRPYLSADVVLVSRRGVEGFDELAFGETIGIRIMAAGDNGLINYLLTRPEGQTWRRTPYPDNALLLERLEDGTIAAAMIWEPGIYGATNGDPEAAGFHVSRRLPFPVDPIEIGVATRAEDNYINGLISEAIAALRADGTIDRLLAEHGLAESAVK